MDYFSKLKIKKKMLGIVMMLPLIFYSVYLVIFLIENASVLFRIFLFSCFWFALFVLFSMGYDKFVGDDK